jgi:hypothetical protein
MLLELIMTRLIKVAPAVALVLGLGTAAAMAAPIPVLAFAQDIAYSLAAVEKSSSKVESTKAWLRTKKNQTSRWIGRQKQKLKRLAD